MVICHVFHAFGDVVGHAADDVQGGDEGAHEAAADASEHLHLAVTLGF